MTRRRRFRSLEIKAIAIVAMLALPAAARAQTCCAGANAVTPGRLAPHEDALVAILGRGAGVVGSFDGDRSFASASPGSGELDFEEDVLGTVRVLRHAQLSFAIPFDETWRKVPGQGEIGAGLGDARLGARYDFTEAPIVALLMAAALPTGVAPESATNKLGTDATGTGSLQLSLGASLEQSFGPWFTETTGSATWHAPRTVGAIHAQRGVAFDVLAAGGYAWDHGPSLALSIAYDAELAARIDGSAAGERGRAFTRIGVGAGVPFGLAWRAQATLFDDLPIRFLGQNEPATLGLSIMMAHVWI